MGVSSPHAARGRPLGGWALRAAWLLCPLGIWFVAGCNPAAIDMLIRPFMDEKEPPKCKLADPKKDVTVAIVTWYGNRDLQLWPEIMPADNELSEKLAVYLRERFKENKDKVKIVPSAQVRAFQSKVFSDTWSPADLGKKVKADKVIALEINSLSLYERASYRQLFRGNAEIAIKVYDLEKPEGEQVVYEDWYRSVHPREQPIAADGSPQQFRAAFVNRIARDLTKWFAAFPSDDRIRDMQSDQ